MSTRAMTNVMLDAIKRFKFDKSIKSDNRLCEQLGISLDSYRNWKNGRTKTISFEAWDRLEDRLHTYLNSDISTKDKAVTLAVLEAFEAYKRTNGMMSDNQLCNKLDISPSTFSSWKHGRAKTINYKIWADIGPHLKQYLDKEKDKVSGGVTTCDLTAITDALNKVNTDLVNNKLALAIIEDHINVIYERFLRDQG